MTLNTFHLAGHGAANVTLGIPRLREIVMTASAHIATPTMKIPFVDETSEQEQRRFVQKASRLTVSEVVDQVLVEERLLPKKDGPRKRKYAVTLQFFNPAEYKDTYGIEVEEVLRGIATHFIPLLEKEIKAELKRSKKQAKAQAADIGRGHAMRMAEASNEEEQQEQEELRHDNAEDMEDGDADDLKRSAQRNNDHDYDATDNNSNAGDLEADFDAAFNDNPKTTQPDSSDESEDEDESSAQNEDSEKKRERLDELESQATSSTMFTQSLTFDKEKGAWCKFDLEVCSSFGWSLFVSMAHYSPPALESRRQTAFGRHHRAHLQKGCYPSTAWH